MDDQTENQGSTPGVIRVAFDRLMTIEPKSLKGYLTTGLVVLLPIIASIWVVVAVANWIKIYFVQPFNKIEIIDQLFGSQPEWFQNFSVGVVSIVMVLAFLVVLGMLTSNVVGKWVLTLIDWFFSQVPLANTVYNFVKNIVESFNIAGGGKFEKVVAIEYPRPNIWSLGFVSGKVSGKLSDAFGEGRNAVFVPTGPNPTTGFIVLAEPGELRELDITPEEALKFIMSGGVLMPGTSETGESGIEGIKAE